MIKLPIKNDDRVYGLHPVKIVCLAKNYAAHAKEFDSQVPAEPAYFCKTPTCLIPSETPVILPRSDLGVERVDYEVELAVIIGENCKEVSESEAMDYIFGYTIFNDITARNVQRHDIGMGWPWFRSKNFDTFGPIGPAIVLRDDIADPQDVPLELKLNGEVKQASSTNEMLFPVKTLISVISSYMTLEEGDIIATGTPEGVGAITAGDIIEATIEPIGTLRNSVMEHP
ncbi:MAG TPA: fumarylacetoacetate hydrolase family protein [Candidatus Lokiarchaeia archaeon]|nr:fumarylacetoacetate hydrolase family protein [Candidatus Lokiarchaeia archaeon]